MLNPEFRSESNNILTNEAEPNPIVKISHLYASWTSDFEGFCISNVSFTAGPGQLVAIVGPTGSGKV